MVPKPQPGTRGALPSTTTGMGRQFSSPRKVKNPRKTKTFVSFPGHSRRCQCLLAELNDLLHHKVECQPPASEMIQEAPLNTEVEMSGILDVGEASDYEQPDPPLVQRARLDHFFSNWKSVIPTIVCPYLEYLSETLGKPVTRHVSPLSACSRVCSDK